MQLQLESTDRTVLVDGVAMRVWEGTTAAGVPVHALVARVGVEEGRPESDYEQFERELQECRPPSVRVGSAYPEGSELSLRNMHSEADDVLQWLDEQFGTPPAEAGDAAGGGG